MSLTLLTQPCSSRFASALYAHSIAPSGHTRRSFATSVPARGAEPQGEAARAQAVEAASENIELGEPAAYLSESSDPWFNLSFEDWLLRNSPRNQPTLFIYRNDPCVVIGRNQNPWQEATPRNLLKWGIPLIRRRSGGGTVFHDRGNTNFSIILPRLLFTRAHGAELVARAIRDRLGVAQCTVNERNDVIIRDETKGKDFKVSGSAYKIIQHRAYHHGTMLISSDLAELGKAIRSSSPNIQGKSVPSFRSAVTTLNTYLPAHFPKPITHESFTAALAEEFAAVYTPAHRHSHSPYVARHGALIPTPVRPEQPGSGARADKIHAGMEELKGWDWTYGQTPEFSNALEADLSFGNVSASVTARHALITSATLHYTPPITASTAPADRKRAHAAQDALDRLALDLVGKRYESLEGLHDVPHAEAFGQNVRREVVQWLRGSM